MCGLTDALCIYNAGLFKVVVPAKAGPGVFMLQNMEWAGLHIAIKSHKVQTVSVILLVYIHTAPSGHGLHIRSFKARLHISPGCTCTMYIRLGSVPYQAGLHIRTHFL